MRRQALLLAAAALLSASTHAAAQQQTATEPASSDPIAVPATQPSQQSETKTTAQGDAGQRFNATPATREGSVERLDGVRVDKNMAASDAMVPKAGHRTGRSSALMIVGGVGIVLGALIGGQAGGILMLGSGAVGLYGLYLYLQ